MRKALLLYNPLSGGRHRRRLAEVQAAVAALRQRGVDAHAEPTRGAADATEQATQAIAERCDTVFACGGDGTVHDVLQGLVNTDIALAIIPLGTANSLAHDMGLPLSPAAAAQAAMAAQLRRIALGRIEYRDFSGQHCSRHFIVAVGIGVDAHLFYKLNPGLKRRLGMGAYYLKATRLWLTHKMETFEVEIDEDGQSRRARVSQILAVRIRDFGGMLRELAPGASIERDDLRLVLFHTHSRFAYLRYIIRGLLATTWNVPGIELVHSSGAACSPLIASAAPAVASRIFVEADGEVLGTMPAKITVVPDALNLLMPTR